MNSLIFIVGSTAVGKTDLAFELAKKNSACIVNADSIQIYKELNIGSSKPDFKKHPTTDCFLFDVASAPEVWTAGDFRKNCLEVLNLEIPKKGALVVGGSGFYIQALEKGMYNIKPSSKEIEERINNLSREKGLNFLYKELEKKDPDTAKKISHNDRYRIVRALSIMENENKTLTQIKKDFKPKKLPWKYKKIGLQIPKDELLKRVKLRAEQMIKNGLIEEVEDLIKKGYQNWKPLQSVGYKEAMQYCKNQIDKQQMLEEIIKNTMHLAKKQKTWFQKDKDIKWFDYDVSVDAVAATVGELL